MLIEEFLPDHSIVQPLTPAKSEQQKALLSGPNSNVLNPRWTTAYSELKNYLKTGDVVLVHGKYPFSWVVELLQWSKWGHSAVVIRKEDIDPDNKYNDLPELMLWESNTGDQEVPNLWGKDSGKVKEGPMLINLEERLKRSQSCYENVEIVHRLLNTKDFKFDAQKVIDHFNVYIGKEFPTDKEIIYSIYLGRKYNRSSNDPEKGLKLVTWLGEIMSIYADTDYILNELKDKDDVTKDKIYCSELVAAFYKEAGLLTQEHVSNAYSPKDFSTEGTVAFLQRSWLGTEMYLNMLK